MRPQGLTSQEAYQLGLVTTKYNLAPKLIALSDFKGWDIRHFYTKNHPVIYKIVGRSRGNRYRSLISVENYNEQTRT